MSRQSDQYVDTDVEPSSSEDGFIEVRGVRTYFVRAGAGPALVLIHGLTGSTVNWRKNIDALARNRTVYAIDLPNMGRSDRTAGLDAGLTASADRLAETMTVLGIEKADIAGHSHGGAIVMMLAARHPDRVRSLILFAPANPYSDSGDSLIRLYRTVPGKVLARIAPYLPRWVQMIALGRMYGSPARIVDGTLEGYVDGLRIKGTVPHVMSIVWTWFDDMTLLETVLPRLRSIPTLLMWGDRDRAVSLSSGRRLHREFSRSELVVIPSAGHIVFEEMPDECNLAMQSWLVSGSATGHEAPDGEPAQLGRQPASGQAARRPRPVSAHVTASSGI